MKCRSARRRTSRERISSGRCIWITPAIRTWWSSFQRAKWTDWYRRKRRTVVCATDRTDWTVFGSRQNRDFRRSSTWFRRATSSRTSSCDSTIWRRSSKWPRASNAAAARRSVSGTSPASRICKETSRSPSENNWLRTWKLFSTLHTYKLPFLFRLNFYILFLFETE